MTKRRSITGLKKKKPVDKTVTTKLPTSKPSSEASEERDGSIASSLDGAPGKRTLLSIQNSRREALQGRINKPTHRTVTESSLRPTLKHVSQAIIQSKWKVLDPSAQAKVESLFRSVGLPVLAKHTKHAGKVEAQDAIALVTRSLCKRLPKMPFPHTTREGHFDYDGLAKSNRDLQQRLLTAADSIASSKAELEKQMIELKRDRRELQRIEDALGDQDIRGTFLSPLEDNSKPDDMPDSIGLVSVNAG